MNEDNIMRLKMILCSGLFSATFALLVLLPYDAVAGSPPSNAIRFGICGNNIRNVLLSQSADTNTWHLEITLNGVGTKQFKNLPSEKAFGNIVELDWGGVSLGRVRYTTVVDSENVSKAKYVHLRSRTWHSLEAARAQMILLGRKDLDVPCGSAK